MFESFLLHFSSPTIVGCQQWPLGDSPDGFKPDINFYDTKYISSSISDYIFPGARHQAKPG